MPRACLPNPSQRASDNETAFEDNRLRTGNQRDRVGGNPMPTVKNLGRRERLQIANSRNASLRTALRLSFPRRPTLRSVASDSMPGRIPRGGECGLDSGVSGADDNHVIPHGDEGRIIARGRAARKAESAMLAAGIGAVSTLIRALRFLRKKRKHRDAPRVCVFRRLIRSQ